MYILDTNVLSETRRSRKAHPSIRRWFASVDASELFLSVISIFEREMGVRRMERRDMKQAAILRVWLQDRVLDAFKGRILPVDIEVSIRCAGLHVPDPRPFRDSFIAATAMAYDMTVVTRNVADFVATGVPILNPWDF